MCSGKFLRLVFKLIPRYLIGQSIWLVENFENFIRLTEQKSLELGLDFESMDDSTIFCFRASKDKIDPYEEDEPDSMGDAEIKFSESLGLCQILMVYILDDWIDLYYRLFLFKLVSY